MIARFLGNAGVELSAPDRHPPPRAYIDAFFTPVTRVGSGPVLRGREAGPADVILVTHAHPDHFLAPEVAAAAGNSGAAVAGPGDVITRLGRWLPPERLAALDPPEGQTPYAFTRRRFGSVDVTAFRTRHGGGSHNSYLIRMDGWNGLHDGDNEQTQYYGPGALEPLDALFLCPWQGSGADRLLQAVKPKQWFLIHLTDAETADHAAGRFLPGLWPGPPPVPPAIGPAPGERVQLETGGG